jgi:hypothetical protein
MLRDGRVWVFDCLRSSVEAGRPGRALSLKLEASDETLAGENLLAAKNLEAEFGELSANIRMLTILVLDNLDEESRLKLFESM